MIEPKYPPVQATVEFPPNNETLKENATCSTNNIEICQGTVDNVVKIGVISKRLEEFFTPAKLLYDQLLIDDLKEVKFNSSIFKLLPSNYKMLPHMPSLTSTPVKKEINGQRQTPLYPDFDEVLTEREPVKSSNANNDEARKVRLNEYCF